MFKSYLYIYIFIIFFIFDNINSAPNFKKSYSLMYLFKMSFLKFLYILYFCIEFFVLYLYLYLLIKGSLLKKPYLNVFCICIYIYIYIFNEISCSKYFLHSLFCILYIYFLFKPQLLKNLKKSGHLKKDFFFFKCPVWKLFIFSMY